MAEYKKRILVTGGMGFIGSNFLNIAVLRYPDYQFVNVDYLTYAANLKNVSEAVKGSSNYVFVEENICHDEAMKKLFSEYKFTDVFHFAAESHVDKSTEPGDYFLMTNVYGTNVLLQCFRDVGAPGIFFHISTDEVYGDLDIDDPAWTETAPIKPKNIYSATKASAEHFVVSYGNVYGIKYIITRSSNNYGPNQDDSKLIPKIIKNALNGENIPLYADGMNFRQWIHVFDNCEALLALFHHEMVGKVYNIGGNDILTNNEVSRTIIDESGSRSKIEYVVDRPGHDKGYKISSDKISAHTGWKPSIAFDEGIIRLIQETKQQHV